jgi:hypothetical protein
MWSPRSPFLPLWKRLIPLLALVVCLVSSGSVRASNSLRLELAEAAKKIASVIKGQGGNAIAVGEFTGPRRLRSSAGPGIAEILAEELKKLGIEVKDDPNAPEVKGDFFDIEDKESDQLAALLKIRILDRSGKVLFEGERGIFGDETLASMFGLTAQLPPNAGPKARTEKLKESIEHPRAHVANTQIAAGADSPYAIEILVKSGDQFVPRAPSDDGSGRAFVQIKRHEIYAIRLINNSPHDAAVNVTIDGLNMFTFSALKDNKTGQPLYTHVLVAKQSNGTILGWHRDNEKSDSFLVGEYAKSAAAEMLVHNSATIGTITACFAAAWPKNGPPPKDEPASRSGDATVRGPEVSAKYTEVERVWGVVRASVSVRYTK